ncbi:hypothetical protein TraAM80_10042 [Trypanosoma rangeli]|uniref:Uncharacterized protein n=1 Tax=Trypanosoma rangeli TaxID=5698 RepID=A0A3R7LY94_TRYRA|nr:uncharacterized protein TraAM80_10042 [Trypanosoma rangeli]RNE95957.1 hypothetical protein TraAM80_10042 [Trypanosoma rangeli]|eukprot:RNE95957.1 hypothetical protein TraAM80_10042 [Trypanosoma rangeli]
MRTGSHSPVPSAPVEVVYARQALWPFRGNSCTILTGRESLLAIISSNMHQCVAAVRRPVAQQQQQQQQGHRGEQGRAHCCHPRLPGLPNNNKDKREKRRIA